MFVANQYKSSLKLIMSLISNSIREKSEAKFTLLASKVEGSTVNKPSLWVPTNMSPFLVCFIA